MWKAYRAEESKFSSDPHGVLLSYRNFVNIKDSLDDVICFQIFPRAENGRHLFCEDTDQ